MRLSRPRLTATVLAATALTLTGCSSDQDSASGPVLTTMGTSSAENTTAATSTKPTTSEKESAEKAEKKDDDAKDTKAKDNNKEDEPKNDRTNVAAGTVCGQVTSMGNGSPLSIVAMTDGVDCDEAMEIFSDYMSDSPSGMPPQGSGAFWTAPNGWTCGGSNYLFPGDEDQKFNKYPSCGPGNNDELVVAVDPERVSELPV